MLAEFTSEIIRSMFVWTHLQTWNWLSEWTYFHRTRGGDYFWNSSPNLWAGNWIDDFFPNFLLQFLNTSILFLTAAAALKKKPIGKSFLPIFSSLYLTEDQLKIGYRCKMVYRIQYRTFAHTFGQFVMLNLLSKLPLKFIVSYRLYRGY